MTSAKIPGLVSLIMPNFNRADIVHETVESVIRQSYALWQLIVVDDGSTDNSLSILSDFAGRDSRITIMSRPPAMTKGANACRNYGLSISEGEFVKWIDSDDLLVDDALEKQLGEFRLNPECMAVFAQGVFFDSDTRELQERWSRKSFSDDIVWDYIRNNVRWPIGGPLWKATFFPSPPFVETLQNSQEWLMHGQQLIRLRDVQYRIIDESVYHIRRGNVRMSTARSGRYYLNQSKARWLMMSDVVKLRLPIKYTLELFKQVVIYFYHAVSK